MNRTLTTLVLALALLTAEAQQSPTPHGKTAPRLSIARGEPGFAVISFCSFGSWTLYRTDSIVNPEWEVFASGHGAHGIVEVPVPLSGLHGFFVASIRGNSCE